MFKEIVLQNIGPEWMIILENAGLLSKLEIILEKIKPYIKTLTPSPELIMNAIRCINPDNIKFILIGQDPYININEATGLSFSTPIGVKIPPSLANIFKSLIKSKLMIKPPICGDLSGWAIQGGLLLNMALTTIIDKSNSHTAIWYDFTSKLIEAIVKNLNEQNKIPVLLLWGSYAKKIQTIVHKYNTHILTWTHPSPLADNRLDISKKFVNCDHFIKTNELIQAQKRRPIVWDTMDITYIFTDGACTGNGSPNAKASFALQTAGGALGYFYISGLVQPFEYTLSSMILSYNQTNTIIPSNNRGELLAIIYALIMVYKSNTINDIIIVSDSEYSIKSILKYYPNRVKAGTSHELKNLDLLAIAHLLYVIITRSRSLLFVHVNASHSKPIDLSTATNTEILYYKGNKKADYMAKTVLERKCDLATNITFCKF